MKNKRTFLFACFVPCFLWAMADEPRPNFSFFGRLQLDGALFMREDYQPLGDGVGFRRVRLGTHVAIDNRFSGGMELDFTDGGVGIRDCYVKYTLNKEWSFRAGSVKENVTMESMTSANDLLFMESACVVSAFAPEFHLGVQGAWSRPRYRLEGGVFFKKISALKEKEFSEANNKEGVNEGISYTARGVWMPIAANQTRGFHVGASGSYRTPKTSTAVSDAVRYSAYSLSYITKLRFLDTGPVTSVSYDWLTGAELAGFYEGFRFQSEYMQNRTSRTDGHTSETFNGYYAQAGYLLFGGQQKYATSRGAFVAPKPGRSWGDVELALRYDRLDLNGTAVKGGSSEGWTVGVNYYATRYVKFQLNYSYISQDKYANAMGLAYVGYDSAGELTRKPAEVDESKGKASNAYGILGVRFQVSF